MHTRQVVITGMSAVTPLGQNLDEIWQRICQGQSGIRSISSFDTQKFKVHFGGEVPSFDPSAYIDAREQKRLDRFAQFALYGAMKAVEDAGIDYALEDPQRCGVIMGSGVGGLREFEEGARKVDQDPSRMSPLMITRMMVNAGAGQISIKYGLQGPISAVATACASSANAIGDALDAIRKDEADVMIAGGSEAALTPLGLGGFQAMRALSMRNDAPQAASRPFDRDRDGFVLSEGAGVLVLEELEHARRRGARIYAEVIGYGSTSDGLHIAAPDPNGKGAARAMKRAIQDANINPDQVGYVNAHGTATELGDKAETFAVKNVFGSHATELAVSSTKSQLGHLLGASGGVELILTTLAVHQGVIPPTINLEEPDPDCDLDYVPNEAREVPISFAMSNSFGFGGHNASLVVGRIDSSRRAA